MQYLSVCCLPAGYAFASDNEYPPYLRLPIEGLILTIDPGLTQDLSSIELTEQLFLGLTDFDPETYEPILNRIMTPIITVPTSTSTIPFHMK